MQTLMGFLLQFTETVYYNHNYSVICGYIVDFCRPAHKLHKILLTCQYIQSSYGCQLNFFLEQRSGVLHFSCDF